MKRSPWQLLAVASGLLHGNTAVAVLDCLRQVAGIGDFEAAPQKSERIEFLLGSCYELKIKALIAAKQAVGRPHALATVRQLQAIKEKTEQPKKCY